MSRSSRLTAAVVAGVMLLVAAACGQKPGVSEQGVAFGDLGLAGEDLRCDPETGQCVDDQGNIIDAETGEVIGHIDDEGSGGTTTTSDDGLGPTASGSNPGDGSGGSTDDPSAGGDDPGGDRRDPSGGSPSGGDTTGVTGTSIKIGYHIPITGAAAVPAPSFRKGSTLYWDWLRSRGTKINGRTVEAVYRNDEYNPSRAVAVCKELVEDEKVFLLIGVAGTDQIQACARYAYSVGVPYISAGVTEIGLTNLSNYFAVWLSYKQQGPLLADLLVDQLGARNERNAMIRYTSTLFEDAHSSFVSAMRARGASLAYDVAISKSCNQSDVTRVSTQIATQRLQNVYVLMSPQCFLQIANATQNQGWHPQWTGVGLSMALDTVANLGCRTDAIDNARFLSPYPAFIDSTRFDRNFRAAGGEDDIQFAFWGFSKVIEQMLRAPGRDLTRERFVYTTERLQNIQSNVFPPVSFSPGDRFGGSSMHLNRADCDINRWRTQAAFVRDF
ncbi:MAG TPA: ABC transporter substrate-binding protein [Actinomycetota bacterium]|nr:ABC transporter substrate-binding protein [Actinomycetota bacterium]